MILLCMMAFLLNGDALALQPLFVLVHIHQSRFVARVVVVVVSA